MVTIEAMISLSLWILNNRTILNRICLIPRHDWGVTKNRVYVMSGQRKTVIARFWNARQYLMSLNGVLFCDYSGYPIGIIILTITFVRTFTFRRTSVPLITTITFDAAKSRIRANGNSGQYESLKQKFFRNR